MAAVVPGNVVPGAYYVLFVADPLNAVTETNESNNLAALPLTVTQALVNREQTAGYTVSVVPNPVANGGCGSGSVGRGQLCRRAKPLQRPGPAGALAAVAPGLVPGRPPSLIFGHASTTRL